jgi:hypothetical protein
LACDAPFVVVFVASQSLFSPNSLLRGWFLSENKNFQFAVGNEGFTGKQKDSPTWSAINASVRLPTL